MPYRSKYQRRDAIATRYAAHPTAFWTWLHIQMVKRSWTPYSLAQRLGIDRHNVHAWQRGALPNAHTCYLLANVLHVSLASVYVLALIPIKADHELGLDAWHETPDLSDDPAHDLMAFVVARGYPDELRDTLLLAIEGYRNSPK